MLPRRGPVGRTPAWPVDGPVGGPVGRFYFCVDVELVIQQLKIGIVGSENVRSIEGKRVKSVSVATTNSVSYFVLDAKVVRPWRETRGLRVPRATFVILPVEGSVPDASIPRDVFEQPGRFPGVVVGLEGQLPQGLVRVAGSGDAMMPGGVERLAVVIDRNHVKMVDVAIGVQRGGRRRSESRDTRQQGQASIRHRNVEMRRT